MDLKSFRWVHEPQNFTASNNIVVINTMPYTDLWQKTFYNFQKNNAHIFQKSIPNQDFCFTAKSTFESSHTQYDQCGLLVYVDNNNWLKCSVEYENNSYQHLGSVVTTYGYSDWATAEISVSIKSMWYKISKTNNDFCIEYSEDRKAFHLMRICHIPISDSVINIGIYACSPANSSFVAIFSDIEIDSSFSEASPK